jgi:hypothetical protein
VAVDGELAVATPEDDGWRLANDGDRITGMDSHGEKLLQIAALVGREVRNGARLSPPELYEGGDHGIHCPIQIRTEARINSGKTSLEVLSHPAHCLAPDFFQGGPAQRRELPGCSNSRGTSRCSGCDLLIFKLVSAKKLPSPLFSIPSESGGGKTQKHMDIQ